MYSPTRFARPEGEGVSNSLKKSVARRRSAMRCSGDSDSGSSEEDGMERDSLRLQRVWAKGARDGAARGSGSGPRAAGFRVFPEQPGSPLRAKKRVDISRPTEGITGLCVPGSVPPKVVSIQDYSFSSASVSVFAGQSVLFLLSSAVPEHVEHVLEGSCDDNSELCFVSPILQRQENVSFEFTPLYVGHVRVTCQVYPEMECIVSIVSPSSFRRVSNALSAAASAHSPAARATPPMLGIYQSAGLGSIRRSNTDSISETMTQSSFFDSDDELSDQYSLHSTPRRGRAPAAAEAPFAAGRGLLDDEPERPLLARDLYDRHTAHDKSCVDDTDIAFKVSVEDFVFRPDTVSVDQGAKIQFTYHGSVSAQKLSCEGEFENVALGGDAAPIYVHQFESAGAFAVVNEVFSFMSCQVTVARSAKENERNSDTAVGNEQNSQNIHNNNSIHREQSLGDFIDSKVLRSKLLKSGGIALKVSADGGAGTESSDDSEDEEEVFDSGDVKSVIDRQLTLRRLKSTQSSPLHQAKESLSGPSPNPVSEGGGPAAGSAGSPEHVAPRLCGSFPLSTAASEDTAPYKSLSPDLELSMKLPTTASRRRHRRKQMQTSVLSAVDRNEHLDENSDHGAALDGDGASNDLRVINGVVCSGSGDTTTADHIDEQGHTRGEWLKSSKHSECASTPTQKLDPCEIVAQKNSHQSCAESLLLLTTFEDDSVVNTSGKSKRKEQVRLSCESEDSRCVLTASAAKTLECVSRKSSNTDKPSERGGDNLMVMLAKASKSRAAKSAAPPPQPIPPAPPIIPHLPVSPCVPEAQHCLFRDVENFFMTRWLKVEAMIDSKSTDKDIDEKAPVVSRYEVKHQYHRSRHPNTKKRRTGAPTPVKVGDVQSAKPDGSGSSGNSGENTSYNKAWKKRHRTVAV